MLSPQAIGGIGVAIAMGVVVIFNKKPNTHINYEWKRQERPVVVKSVTPSTVTVAMSATTTDTTMVVANPTDASVTITVNHSSH